MSRRDHGRLLPGDVTYVEDPSPPVGPFMLDKREVIVAFERAYLISLMRYYRGHVSKSARQACIQRSALQRLLKRHGLKSADFRKVTE